MGQKTHQYPPSGHPAAAYAQHQADLRREEAERAYQSHKAAEHRHQTQLAHAAAAAAQAQQAHAAATAASINAAKHTSPPIQPSSAVAAPNSFPSLGESVKGEGKGAKAGKGSSPKNAAQAKVKAKAAPAPRKPLGVWD